MAKADQGSILGVLRIGDYGKDSGGRSVIVSLGELQDDRGPDARRTL